MSRLLKTFVLASLACVLTACGGGGPEGTWTVDREATRASIQKAMEDEASKQGDDAMGQMGQAMMAQMLDSMMGEFGKMTIEMKGDKTFTASVPMESKPVAGKWSMSGDKVTLTPDDGKDPITATLDGDQLVMESGESDMPDIAIYLNRQKK